MEFTTTGIKSETCGFPNGLTMQLVSVTALPSVMLMGGQKRLKSSVKLYVPGEHAHKLTPIVLLDWACAVTLDWALAIEQERMSRPSTFQSDHIDR